MISFSRPIWTRSSIWTRTCGAIRPISFSDFFGGADAGGRGPSGNHASSDDKFYRALGVTKTATDKEIKTAYKKAAMKNHPDKGGDPDKFKDISRAYEVLSDKDKRQAYDMYGEAGVDTAPGAGPGAGYPHGMDPMDIFESVFGFKREQGGTSAKMEDKHFQMNFTLEDLYTGVTREFSIMREIICQPCKGAGGTDAKTCRECNGSGQTVQRQSMGPFFQQFVETCRGCKGRGQIIPPGKTCKPCSGRGIKQKTESLSLEIPRGTAHGAQFRFQGRGDERVNTVSGDVIITINQTAHDVFQRLGADLLMQKEISLQDALCGLQFKVKFLDGKDLYISTKRRVVKPNDVWKVAGKGLQKSHGVSHGDLFITFDIKFPDSVHTGERAREILKELGIDKSAALQKNTDAIEAKPLEKADVEKLTEKIRRLQHGF